MWFPRLLWPLRRVSLGGAAVVSPRSFERMEVTQSFQFELQRGERIEALARVDHGRTMRQAGKVADHHAEAMVERHGDADLVLLGVVRLRL